jgi:hypothetical protein
MMDLTAYRERPVEQQRIADLLTLVPPGRSVLDAGAREGYISRRLTSSFEEVVALDLKRPEIPDEKVQAVQGDITALQYPDSSFDSVICAEVLEHIPPTSLQRACDELARVARSWVVVGVPYRQDTRVGRTTCGSCGKISPPWGHVNQFDERRLEQLFRGLRLDRVSFVGENHERTNFLSTFLSDMAGNPYGCYSAEEGCIHCGAKLVPPPPMSLFQKALSWAAGRIRLAQRPFISAKASWIHARFRKA